MHTEIKDSFIKKYPFKTELHSHTLPVSPCSEFYPKELLERYKKLGTNTVVLTNHLTPEHLFGKSQAELAKEYVAAFNDFKTEAEEVGVKAIFGIEIRFAENKNDYLLYGVKENDTEEIISYLGGTLEDFYKGFQREDILIIQAHPKRDRMTEMDPRLLDGVEAFNLHPGHNSRIAFATSYANTHGLLITGGTDFHHPTHEGSCFLRTKKLLSSPEDVVDVIKRQDIVFDVGGSIIFP